MTSPRFTDDLELRDQWHAACQAWQRELQRVYGRAAGDARFDPARQAATPELRRLYEEFHRLRRACYGEAA